MHKGSLLCGAVGAFETPTNTRLAVQVFVAEKGDYYGLSGDTPQFEAVPHRPSE